MSACMPNKHMCPNINRLGSWSCHSNEASKARREGLTLIETWTRLKVHNQPCLVRSKQDGEAFAKLCATRGHLQPFWPPRCPLPPSGPSCLVTLGVGLGCGKINGRLAVKILGLEGSLHAGRDASTLSDAASGEAILASQASHSLVRNWRWLNCLDGEGREMGFMWRSAPWMATSIPTRSPCRHAWDGLECW